MLEIKIGTPAPMGIADVSAEAIKLLPQFIWPVAMVVTLVLFRKEIADLLNRIRRFSGPGNTAAEFGEKIADLVEQVQVHEALQTSIAPNPAITDATANLKSLSDDELRAKVEDCALKMRELELSFNAERNRDLSDRSIDWEEHTRRLLERSDEQRRIWSTTLLPIARSLRDELRTRLGSNFIEDDRFADFIFEGMLAGANPLNHAALRLEQLARQLAGPSGGPKAV